MGENNDIVRYDLVFRTQSDFLISFTFPYDISTRTYQAKIYYKQIPDNINLIQEGDLFASFTIQSNSDRVILLSLSNSNYADLTEKFVLEYYFKETTNNQNLDKFWGEITIIEEYGNG